MFFKIASAHEVYVLSSHEISNALTTTSPNPFTAIGGNESLFILWGVVIAVGLLVLLAFSDACWSENTFDPILIRLKKYAPFVGRLTFGIAMVASGYFGDFFGPELPVAHLLGNAGASILSWVIIVAGVFICVGLFTRLMALIGLLVFVYTILNYDWYMLTYINYLGEILLFLILGGGIWSIDHAMSLKKRKKPVRIHPTCIHVEQFSFLILRVLFGSSLIVASFYAKFLHSNLALQTVSDYHLTDYFHFTPLFLVLGAFLVEALIGLCFILGFQIRLASIVFWFGFGIGSG